MYSVCVDRYQSKLEQLESLSFLIVSLNFLSSSQSEVQRQISCKVMGVRVSETQHLIISMFGSRFLKLFSNSPFGENENK